MNKTKKIFAATIVIFALAVLFAARLASAAITSIDTDTLYPGDSAKMTIRYENDLNKDIEDVTFSMAFAGLPISSSGSSEDSIKEILDGDRDKFVFVLRADNSAKPGDYDIPYVLSYRNDSAKIVIQEGTIGIKISGRTEIDFSSSVDNPIINQRGKITLKIINKGDGEARFTSVKILPEGYTLLSEDNVYIGTVNADDFESATFDVLFNSAKARLVGILEYKDLENNKLTKNIEIPLKIYTKEEAIKQGIITKNNTGLYIAIGVALIIIWLIVRAIRKRMRMKKSREAQLAR